MNKLMLKRAAVCILAAMLLVFSGCGAIKFDVTTDNILDSAGKIVFPPLNWRMSPEETENALGIKLERIQGEDASTNPTTEYRSNFLVEDWYVDANLFGTEVETQPFMQFEYGELICMQLVLLEDTGDYYQALVDAVSASLGDALMPELDSEKTEQYVWQREDTKLAISVTQTSAGTIYTSVTFMQFDE